MNKISYLKATILLTLTVAVFVACDDDYNVLGTDIVGVDNFGFGDTVTYDAKTTSLDLGAVESSDLPIVPFGVYNNPVFGLMEANYVTQLEMDAATEGITSVNPTIDLTKNPEIVSVILRVPYISKLISTNADLSGNYELDSIYGPSQYTPMNLSVYESGYFMRDVDPADQSVQSYYSDQSPLFESYLVGNRLNDDSDAVQNDNFTFSSAATTVTKYSSTGDETPTFKEPAIKLKLNAAFFNQKILRAPAGKLLNNNVFKDYFRGIYFKVEQNAANPGNLAMLNFKKGIITVNYKEDGVDGKVFKRIILNMTGKSASLVKQANPNIGPDPTKLFIKGGANNSMAVIDLFTADQLTEIRNNNWLINDASLTFTIDNALMNGTSNPVIPAASEQPLRVYLYDLTNNRQIIDYALDASPGTNSAKYSKRLFGGIIKKDAAGRGTSYTIRLTNHVRNIAKLDSTNVKLGLVVTEDINTITNKKIKNPALGGTLKVIPTMSIVHPLGTVLFGSDAIEALRPKFKIYYTTPTPKQN